MESLEDKNISVTATEFVKLVCNFWDGVNEEWLNLYYTSSPGNLLIEYVYKKDIQQHDFYYFWNTDTIEDIKKGMEPALVSRYTSLSLKQKLLDLEPKYSNVKIRFIYNDQYTRFLSKVLLKYEVIPQNRLF